MKDKTVWQGYCRKLLESYKEIEVLSIPDLSESSKMPLKKLYVPLTFSHQNKSLGDVSDEENLLK
ncbi:MAG: hypothetical protein L0Y73_04035, partial [Candidatus Aminicenantes bacterium]|nr:hypothetical protein [Candidatus Aminicenantes bacterium]